MRNVLFPLVAGVVVCLTIMSEKRELSGDNVFVYNDRKRMRTSEGSFGEGRYVGLSL